MTKQLHFKSLLLLVAMLLGGSSSAWAGTVADKLSQKVTGITGTSYTDFSDIKVSSDAVYAGQCAGSNSSIQLRSKNSNSGVITTVSGGKLKKIVVEWESHTVEGRVLNVYGSSTAYTAATDLYDENKQGTLIGTIVCGTSTELEVSDEYEYVGLRSDDGAIYLTSVTITWEKASDPSKADPGLSFPKATYEATIGGEEFTAPALQTAEGFTGTIEYESSDENVAQIMDSETGELRLLKEGTTTITASFAGNEKFNASSASYTLTVTDNRIATTTIQDDIVLDKADVATLTWLKPVVKDASGNVVTYQYEEWPTEISFEIVSDEYFMIGSLDNNTGEITLNDVEGTATLKAYYNYFNANTSYKPSECTFTISVVSTLDNIAALTAKKGTGTYWVNLTDAVVTYVNGKYAYIQDASGAVAMFKENHGLTAGDVLNGKATVTYQVSNGNPKITSLEGVKPVAGTAPDPTVVTAEDWSFGISEVLSQYFQVIGAKLTKDGSKYYVSLGGVDVQLYKASSSIGTLDLEKTYTITGFPTLYVKNETITEELQIFEDPVAEGGETEPEAPNVTWDLSKDETATATTSEISWTSTYVSMKNVKASASTNTNNYYPGTEGKTYTSTRFYKNSELAIVPAAGAITSVVFTATQDSYATALKNSTWTNATATVDGTIVTVTPTDGTKAIYATISGTCGLTAVKVYYEELTTVSVSVPASKMTTFSYGAAVDFNGTGITAYTAKATGAVVRLTAVVDNIVPANTGVVLKAESEINTKAAITTGGAEVSDNDLVPMIADGIVVYNEEGSDKYNYILQTQETGIDQTKTGFWMATGLKLKGGKAYLSIDLNIAAAPASRLEIVFDDATGISTVNGEGLMVNGSKDAEVYNLQGQRVSKAQKGLYIVDGKKVIMK